MQCVKYSEFRDAIHEYNFVFFFCFFFVMFFLLLFKYSLATSPMQISYTDF